MSQGGQDKSISKAQEVRNVLYIQVPKISSEWFREIVIKSNKDSETDNNMESINFLPQKSWRSRDHPSKPKYQN